MTGPAPNGRTYRYPRRSWWSWLAALLVSAGVCAGAVYFQFDARVDTVARGQLLIFAAVFASLAVHAYGALRVVSGRVEMREDGLVHEGVLVPWTRVQRVDIQPLLRRMDVFDDTGAHLLRLRPELEAFGGVQAYIIERMQPRAPAPPTEVPLLSPVSGGVPLAAFALIAVWFGPRQSGVPALLSAGIAGLLLAIYAVRRRTLRLEREALVLREGWRRERLPYADIAAVRLATQRSRRGQVPVVVLERQQGEPLVLAGFRGGYRAAAATIEQAWRTGGGR